MAELLKNEISFRIRCLSPTFNYGSEKRPDATGLRATSIRGLWRFWARAVIAGILSNPESKYIRILENGLFGSIDPPFRTFRMRLTALPSDRCQADYFILPHKQQHLRRGVPDEMQRTKKGVPPGREVEISLVFNQSLVAFKKSLEATKPSQAAKVPIWNDTAQKALLSVIWLWSNLGGIGIRSRRGFGATELLPDTDGNDPFSLATLPICKNKIYDTNSLRSHLECGILKSFDLIKTWINSWDYATKSKIKDRREASPDMFKLSGLDQIFLSTNTFDQLGAEPSAHDGVLKVISDKPVIDEETGYVDFENKRRLASPMIVTLHSITEDGQRKYIPVLTWSPRFNLRIDKTTGNGPWLQSLGFDKSLAGESIYV